MMILSDAQSAFLLHAKPPRPDLDQLRKVQGQLHNNDFRGAITQTGSLILISEQIQ